ncbi:MAG: hypothetical protein ACLT90_04305 [Enterococcus raffinosus]
MELIKDTEVRSAYQLLKNAVNHTPLQYDRYLSEKYQATVLLKRRPAESSCSFKLARRAIITHWRSFQRQGEQVL